MFDDEYLAGSYIVNFDNKHRIFLSKRIVNADKEKLVLIKQTEELYFLCGPRTAMGEIKKINNSIDQFSREDKIELLNREIEKLESFKTILVDKQGRMTIDIFKDAPFVKEIGAGDRIYLQPVYNKNEKQM